MATVRQRLEALQDQGFDSSYAIGRDDSGRFTKAIRVRCGQCEALAINGIACHETNCPNIPRVHEDEYDEYDEFTENGELS